MNLKNKLIYQVYTRNHTEEGTFKALIPDLKRIKELGTDIFYLMPIHPIGEVDRKGTAGSPYAIKDYYGINSEFGTLEDFQELIDEVHNHDMKVMIDVVVNHTSPDSVLINDHPEWFYRTPEGKFGNKVGDWWDIKDLEYRNNPELKEYIIQMFEYWAKLGVDGFRADVASLVPLDLWVDARERLAKINPDFIWLAESVHLSFNKFIRDNGFVAVSDHDLYQAFDIQYQYDFWDEFVEVFKGEESVGKLVYALKIQDAIYPKDYNKLRFLENHDQPRFMSYGLNPEMYHAFIYFLKGTTFIFGGQEFLCDHLPSLFDKDTNDYTKGDISPLLKKLYEINQDEIMNDGIFTIDNIKDCVFMSYKTKDRELLGIFNFKGETIKVKPQVGDFLVPEVSVEIADGKYLNLITDQEVEVKDSSINFNEPVIINIKK